MRQTILTAAAAFVIGGIATGAALTQAQPAPPPAGQLEGASPAAERPAEHHWTGGWGRHSEAEAHGGLRRRMRAFALIYRQPDRQLASADVQKIAEGFLLWNGNHSWKVSNVAPTPDGPIGFSLTTPEGSVIAKFTMDPHTGKIDRIG